MDFIIDYLDNFRKIFSAMSPWLLAGYMAAGIIAYFLNPNQIKKHLGGRGLFAVLKAVLAGVPLPVCSCGVIPIATALRNEGAGKGATGAFFIATPQIGVDSAIVTASMLGWSAALIRAITAFLSGFSGGVLISLLCPETAKPVEENPKTCCCCNNQTAQQQKDNKNPLVFILSYGFLRMLKSTVPSLLAGMAVAALIQQFVPENFGAEYLCGNMILEFTVVLIFSIPLYICSSASVPVAVTLMLKGFSPGAALLFLIAGPTIHSVSITFMKQIIGTRAMLIAVTTIAFWAIMAGLIVNLFDIPVTVIAAAMSPGGHSGTLQAICGIILAVLVCRAIAVRYIFTQKSSNMPNK